jgi:hypothetical protein
MPTSNNIDRFREAKAAVEKLYLPAKKDQFARANELAAEITQITKELRDDFGHKWVFPKNGRPRKRVKPEPAPQPKPSPEIARLQRKLETQKRKLAAAKDPAESKRLQDKVYETEDELRLLIAER